MKKLVVAAALALFAAAPVFAGDEESGCKNCPHHEAAAKADGAKADAAPGATACACKKGDANATCKCEPGKCACPKAAAHGEAGHDCPMHGGAKGETKT